MTRVAVADLIRDGERVAPVVLARDRALPVVEALAPLLPEGLRRGSSVAVGGGPGRSTLALALLVAAMAEGSWAAVVGMPALGLAAALELGVVPERFLVVATPPRESWASVVAALVEAVDLVVVAPRHPTDGEVRRLDARVRERASVLVSTAPWPGADVRLTVASSEWSHEGRFVARRATVTATGRRAAARERRTTLWLPAPSGELTTISGRIRPEIVVSSVSEVGV
jgi:hypothetical protein